MFFFNDPATTEIYTSGHTLSLHDARPIFPTLKRMFVFPIAYSDHTPGWDMDLAAVALGANLVEKTISEDRTTRSVEHVMSIEPAEMARFIADRKRTRLNSSHSCASRMPSSA